MFAMRGHLHWGERFIKELGSRYLPFKIYNPEKKEMEDRIFEMRVSPIQLYDCVFPEEHFDAVANTIFSGGKGDTINPKLNKYFWMLRKALGLKKMPEYKKDTRLSMSLPVACEMIAIGVKEDYWVNEKNEHVSKENKTPLSWEGL